MSDNPRRTTAEWLTFGVACAVVATVIVLLGIQWVGTDEPAAPRASVTEVRAADGRFFVSVELDNGGDRAAMGVQVNAELDIDGDVTSADQVVDVLGAGASERLVFVFGDDPALGDLTVEVGGFTQP